MNKVYLCDSDSVLDVFAWNPQFTENNIAVITKSDVPSLRDMVKDELQKATKIDVALVNSHLARWHQLAPGTLA